ncbi:MAG: murein transglycosylase [Micavibrio sp.]|nr:murein transglycosylase [Micavibrio sp.]
MANQKIIKPPFPMPRNFFWACAFFACILGFGLTGCNSSPPPDIAQPEMQQLALTQTEFSSLPGWPEKRPAGFIDAFSKTCARLSKKDKNAPIGDNGRFGYVQDWLDICEKMPEDEGLITSWLVENFNVFEVSDGISSEGLFTGYYEAYLSGSYEKTDRYNVPLRARPDDLIMVNLGEFRDELKGQRIAGRNIDGRLKPYENREQITSGALPQEQDKALLWVDSPIDAFFLEIQGSGIVKLENGETVRVGYAGQNGHLYKAIGKTLVEQNELQKEKVSMQSIRAWLENNPARATEIMNTNPSYVFFEESKDTEGPKGGEGIALTAERSLAIDHGIWPYGLPFWVSTQHPDETKAVFQKLMVGQDTGGAIKGAVRGDIFWGSGKRAELLAGKMKSRGTYYVFLPKDMNRLVMQ